MWANVADFQRAELVHIIKGESTVDAAIDLIVANAERVGEVFSLKERKPRAKETKPRKALGKSLCKSSAVNTDLIQHSETAA